MNLWEEKTDASIPDSSFNQPEIQNDGHGEAMQAEQRLSTVVWPLPAHGSPVGSPRTTVSTQDWLLLS